VALDSQQGHIKHRLFTILANLALDIFMVMTVEGVLVAYVLFPQLQGLPKHL
jgi:hypothetical protein